MKFKELLKESTYSALSTIAGQQLQSGRMTILGCPVDIDSDESTQDTIVMTAVDRDAAGDLVDMLRARGFTVKRVNDLDLVVGDLIDYT